MNTSQKKIMESLSKEPMSLSELSYATGYTKDSIRGRISELRKLGYIIELKPVDTKKYFLSKNNQEDQKILDFIKNRNLYQKPIEIEQLSKTLKISLSELKDALSRIFKSGKLVQLSTTKIMFKR